MNEFRISKGVNLSHWISQVFGWSPREKYITKDDIRLIASFGFDHVRIPFDEEELWDENNCIKTTVLSSFLQCVEWCITYNLKVVIDFHILRSHHFNNANSEGAMTLWSDKKEQEKFLRLWDELSAIFKKYPHSHVAYELMNEPVAPTNGEWNRFIKKGIDFVSALEPERTLLYGPNEWQMIENFPDLYVPEEKNLLLSFHTYEPLLFTHYKAYWLPIEHYKGNIHYPGVSVAEEDLAACASADEKMLTMIHEKNRYYDIHVLEELFSLALAKSKETGYQLYCGEFGCLPSVERTQRLQYFKDITSIFKKHDIAFTCWDYKGDFGIVEWDRGSFKSGKPDEELIAILVE